MYLVVGQTHLKSPHAWLRYQQNMASFLVKVRFFLRLHLTQIQILQCYIVFDLISYIVNNIKIK